MIPIYRAKKIDSDEYVEGYYSPDKNYQENIHTIFYFDIGDFNVDRKTITQIDATTLAIHFPDMLDSKGNKIFASLSEDGKGGDIFQYNNFTDYRELDNQTSTVVINQGRYALLIGDNFHSLFAIQGKVIGIQE